MMVNQLKLINDTKFFEHDSFTESFLKHREADCILYSEEGTRFNIHKEILYQTKFMRNIFVSATDTSQIDLEIFCPCSENELDAIVNFLYSGKISNNLKTNVTKVLKNLTKIFGFSEELFTVEDFTSLNKPKNESYAKAANLEDILNKIKTPKERYENFGSNDIKNVTLDNSMDKNDPLIIAFNPTTNGISENYEVPSLNSDVISNEQANVIAFVPDDTSIESTIDPTTFVSTVYEDLDVNDSTMKKIDIIVPKILKGKHSCGICMESFKKKTTLVNHISSVHKGKKPLKCPVCQKQFGFNKSNLQSHIEG